MMIDYWRLRGTCYNIVYTCVFCVLLPNIIPPIFRIVMKFNMNDVLNSRAWIWLFAILNTSCVYIHLRPVYMRFSYIITMRNYSCSCTRHGGLAAVEVQLHWFLTSTLEGQELSPSLLVCLLLGKFLMQIFTPWTVLEKSVKILP